MPPSPTNVWERQDLPAIAVVLFATRADDLWMIADGDRGVFRWNGMGWVSVLTVSEGDYFVSIWGSAPNDVWVGGPRLRHWDGATWSDLTAQLGSTSATVRRLWGRAPNDVWLAASYEPSRIFHWDGSSWTERTPPLSLSPGAFTAYGIWGSSPNDVWAAGYFINSVQETALLHWTGTAWENPALAFNSGAVNSIWGSAANDIWVGNNRGMAHFDGVSWSLAASSPAVRLTNAPTLWGSCATDVWAVVPPDVYENPQVSHFDGVRWSGVTLDGNPRSLLTITGTGPDDLWVAGFTPNVTESVGPAYHRHQGDPAPACGNVRIDPGEECDPPDGHSCDAACLRIPICGNGTLERGEECDPPHTSPPFPGCDSSCHLVPVPACVKLGAACDATVPCCDNQSCSNGFCGGSQCFSAGDLCGGTIPCCGALLCSGLPPTCHCLPSGTPCTTPEGCCDGTCTNGRCGGCSSVGSQCDANNPCCSGLVCSSSGVCVKPQPTCLPDGALCSASSPCCSGASCVNGLCGGACILDGAACDGSHPCCKTGSTCTNGVCGGVTCGSLGQNCGAPGGCCPGSICGGAGLCRSQGGSCADVGYDCNVVGNGCCSGSTCGPGGTCLVVVGCYPPGQDCTDFNLGTAQCCSGVCARNVTGSRGRCL